MFTAHWLCVIFLFFPPRDRITGEKNKGEKKCCACEMKALLFSHSSSASCATDNNIQHNTIPDDIYCSTRLLRRKKRKKNLEKKRFIPVIRPKPYIIIKRRRCFTMARISTCARVSCSIPFVGNLSSKNPLLSQQ